MEWSPQQVNALQKVKNWDTTNQQVFKLFGYAGTGKTTLAKHIAETFGGNVGFGAYTGKAASNLTKSGCPARTIHSWIYAPSQSSEKHLRELKAQLEDTLKTEDESHFLVINIRQAIEDELENLKRPYFTLRLDSEIRHLKLFIIDECSMLDQFIAEDILSFGIPVLVMGDPAQLPPVKGKGYFMDNPDVTLTEIHRQAKDNPIIQLAWDIRTGKSLKHQYVGEFVSVLPKKGFPVAEIAKFDQVLCGTNKTRFMLNRKIRKSLGIDDNLPVKGEKVICLKNNLDRNLMNGELFEVEDSMQVSNLEVNLTLRGEVVPAHTRIFWGEKEQIPFYDLKDSEQFDYGYAITTHKSQGSQWPSVCVVDESYISRGDAMKWLYTAVTRAENNVTVLI